MDRYLHIMERQNWADYAKGIAIFLVVLCHTVNGTINAGLTQANTWWSYCSDLFYIFMVPVFFFLAGYFAEGSKARRGLRKFLIGLLNTIAYPYFLWSIVQILLMMSIPGASNARPSWVTILSLPIDGYAQFWFLYALFSCYIFDVLLSLIRLNRVYKLLISLVILVLGESISSIGEQLYWLCSHYSYFVIGSMFSANFISQLSSRSLLAVNLTALTLLNYLFIHKAGYGTPLRAIAAVVGIGLVIVLSMLLERLGRFAWLGVLGLYSLEIYCLHTITAAGTRYFILRILNSQNIWLHSIAGTLLGICVPLLIAKINNKYKLSLFRWGVVKPSMSLKRV